MRASRAGAEALRKRCGFLDPLLDEEPVTCAELERAARCITADRKARVSHRRRDEPSFIERGSVP